MKVQSSHTSTQMYNIMCTQMALLFHLHLKWSNLLWDVLWITKPQIMQVLKFRYGRYLGNCQRKDVLKQNISPLCNLCPSHQNNMCLRLLFCCRNEHINKVRTNCHNKVIHAATDILPAHPTTRCSTPINASKT
jgi:hypothetical protein